MNYETRNRLAEANLDIVDVALRVLLTSDTDRFETIEDDLRGAGNLALLEAVEKFPGDAQDDRRGLRAYAYVCIRSTMLQEARLLLDLTREYDVEWTEEVGKEYVRWLSEGRTVMDEDKILRIVDLRRAVDMLIRGEST